MDRKLPFFDPIADLGNDTSPYNKKAIENTENTASTKNPSNIPQLTRTTPTMLKIDQAYLEMMT